MENVHFVENNVLLVSLENESWTLWRQLVIFFTLGFSHVSLNKNFTGFENGHSDNCQMENVHFVENNVLLVSLENESWTLWRQLVIFFTLGFSHVSLNKNFTGFENGHSDNGERTLCRKQCVTCIARKTEVGLFGDNLLF